jgi:glycosyltransferase involved in cell wall biosynthesis
LLAVRRIDLVHVHFGYAAADVVGTIGRRPYVLSLHGDDATRLVGQHPDHYSRVTGAVDRVVVPSRFLAAAAERAGFASRVITVIPSGVDTAYFTPSPLPDDPRTIAYVGRLVEKKGLDVLLAAWPAIHAEVPAATLHILGDGPLAKLIDSTDGSISHIVPDPSRRHDQVRDLIRSASVVVTPSRTAANGDSESLLLVNLEAGASGRPVVSTRHGGIPEYVEDGRTGLLVPENDSAALAEAVIRVLRDRQLAERLATAAVSGVAQWDVRTCAARVDALYDSLLDPRTRK